MASHYGFIKSGLTGSSLDRIPADVKFMVASGWHSLQRRLIEVHENWYGY